jgi:hypothetical protein
VVFGGLTIPKHIETWSLDDGCNAGVGASAALVQQWVTYANANCGNSGGDAKILSDCISGTTVYCKTIQYLDTGLIYYTPGSSSGQWTSYDAASAGAPNDDWFVHSASAGVLNASTRLINPNFSGGYWDNIANPAVQAFYQNFVRTNYPNDYGLRMDDVGMGVDAQWYAAAGSPKTSHEFTTNAQLQAAVQALAGKMTHSNGTPYIQIDNGDNDNPYLTSNLPLLNNPASVVGMMMEGAPWYNGIQPDWKYQLLLDNMAYIDHTANDFQVLLSYDSNGPLQGRRVQAATILLGYSPGHTVSWSALEGNSRNLTIWPEEGIYPTNPVQTMGTPSGTGCFAGTGIECPTGGHNDIQVATGVYRREFGKCYNQGVAFGPCAIIINDSGSTVTVPTSWLTQSYSHQITMVGGDVQSGGTVNLTGASFSPGSTTIPAGDAILIAQ